MRTLILIVFILLPLVSNAEKQEPKKLSFGVVLGLTGLAAEHAGAINNGITLAVENLKKEGWQVDFKIQDDQTVPAKTVSAVQSLLSQGYRFFIGPTWSFQSKAAEPVLRNSNALAFVPGGSSLINGGPSEALFNMCPRRDKQAPIVADWFKKQPLKKAFLLTANGDWGAIHRDVFVHAIKEGGGELVGEEYYDYGADPATIRSILLRASNKGFNILFVTTSANDVSSIVKARKQLNKDFAIFTTDTIEDALRLKLVSKNDLKNVYMTHLPMSPGFSDLHMKRFGDEARTYSDRGYDAVMALAEAVEHTDGTVAAVKKYLRDDLNMKGFIGNIEFDKSGDIVASNYQVSSLF